MRTKKLPAFLKQYFWDVDFESMDFEKRRSVLKRVMDKGDTRALRWILRHYTNEDIKQILLTTRDLSAKTANFWANYLGVVRSKVRCLQKPYSPIPFGLSS